MGEFNNDKKWSDKWLPRLKSLCGQCLIETAPDNIDKQENTDLVMPMLSIACRVRRYCYYHLYKDEFTIRAHRDTGATTEFEKMSFGLGDYMIYAFADKEENRLQRWTLMDLSVLRRWLCDSKEFVITSGMSNGDGTYFFPFKYIDLPEDLIVACSWKTKIIKRDRLPQQTELSFYAA